ncbi:MAG: hypothetical protein IPM29_31920 [Planctomycetes bacterium]|nr:hypothetical protein [Planctomycetota bacterium]
MRALLLSARRALAGGALLLSAFLASGMLAPAAVAQERAVALQAEAQRRFQELHERMQRLQLVKAEQEPDESRTLEQGNRLIQERSIHDRMATIRDLLTQERFDEALDAMGGVRKDLDALLDLLLNRELDLEELLAEIERLEAYKERVEALIDEQRAEKNAAAEAEALQKQLERLEAAQRDVKALLDAQDALREQANRAGLAAQPAEAERMAKEQQDLQQRATDLEPRLRDLERNAEKLGTQPKPAEAPKPGEAAQGGSCSGSCQSAAGAMGQSQQKLQKNKPERALEDMDAARRALQQTLQQLEQMSEEARRKLLALPFDQQAKAQERTAVSTDRLAQDMEADDQKADEAGQPRSTPGKKPIQQAVPKQKAAAGQLKDVKPGDAAQEQQDALEDLQQAKKELEDALAQLRQELQDEVLRALEERFAKMLEVQKDLSARTRAAHRLAEETLGAAGAVPRAVADRAAEIGGGERGLAGEANDALKLLAEDGSTAAFPAVVEMLRDDFNAVADRLEQARVGRTTQELQAEIEQTLKDLIDALRRQIEANQGGGQCQCNGQPVLVPRSAELKLVMIKQQRVNRRTTEYDRDVPEQLRVTEEAQEAARELARQQGTVEDLLRRMATQLEKDEQARNR